MIIYNLVSQIFNSIVNYRNHGYNSGKYKILDCGKPLISVGNISSGGSGKTPFVLMLADEFIKAGYRPAIIGRGYKKIKKGEVIVSDGVSTFVGATEAGDEMFMLASRLKVPIVANEDKKLAALSAVKLFNPDLIILDDGFQHRSLKRDIDIVLIDRESIERPFLLPKGRLREPFESLLRSDYICINENLQNEINNFIVFDDNKKVVFKNSDYNYIFIESGESATEAQLDIARKSSLIVSGIAHSEIFLQSLKNNNFNTRFELAFEDHHNYSEKDIKRIINICLKNNLKYIITTDKDAVKLINFHKSLKQNDISCIISRFDVFIIGKRDSFINNLITKLNLK
ncbi:MAG: tetraacyldisaccharide 4'-kinase [Candidatus Kapabacteria bacterium]|nr:tetraacyldisaccharide 4'-kinase [Candidatus Kapabacteria bacterium]